MTTGKTGKQYALGLDYGTNSVRALIVDLADGRAVGSCVSAYPSGEAGVLLDHKQPNLARQHPGDYLEGFFAAAGGALAAAKNTTPGFDPAQVVGIGIDTTGSTPLPVDADGVALGVKPEFKNNLAAQAWLWKDHTSFAEAAEITAKAAAEGYLAKCGGTYSSEWYWSKALHCRRTAPKVFAAAASWVELADFIPAYLTGNTHPKTLKRGICAAGHKALYHEQWGGLPRQEFLAKLDPEMPRLAECYAKPAVTADTKAGGLTAAVAQRVGLPEGTPVAVGAFDAHMGAVGAGIRPGSLVKIMGTSTCDIMIAPLTQNLPDIPGLCGIVPGSVLADMYGLEAGQSAVGDIFNWFVKYLTPAGYGRGGDAHERLTSEAQQLAPGESGLLALDWNNGNRTILVDPLLTGLLLGQTLHTTAAEIYRALMEATAFGALAIIQRLEEYGVAVKDVINCGGIAEKNPFAMQIYADVCNRPMKISRSPETCALGAAIFGAVAAGAYPDVPTAQQAMTGFKDHVYQPRPAAVAVYTRLNRLYRQLHDAFGTKGDAGSLHNVMKDLLAIRNQAKQENRS